MDSENSYRTEDLGKKVAVFVDRTSFTLSSEAMSYYEEMHDEWEMDVCKKYPHDVLISGLYHSYLPYLVM